MCYIVQILVYLVRSTIPACSRGRKEEKGRLPDEPSAYAVRSRLETPNTVGKDVKPESRRWEGYTEEDILAAIRVMKGKEKEVRDRQQATYKKETDTTEQTQK
jgi:hypothetical protein